MDIYEYLKMDHDHLSLLFKQFKSYEDKLRQQQIVELIAKELFAHDKAEQETFYTALGKYAKTKEDAAHGRKEHREIEDQVQTILQAKPFGTLWLNNIKKLQDLVDSHVKEEESTVFKKAKLVLSEEEAYSLKKDMHNLKQQLLLRGLPMKTTPSASELLLGAQQSSKQKDGSRRLHR